MKVDIFNTNKKYQVIYADPPYRFSQGISPRKTYQSIVKEELNFHYPTMSDKEISNFSFSKIADDQCVLFCWTTDAHLPASAWTVGTRGATR